MHEYDLVILTDDRYVAPKNVTTYIQNILTEEGLLIEALAHYDLKVIRKSWSDPNFNWLSTKYACFRSTWDYFDRYQEFNSWLHQTASKLQFINPVKLVQWNLDKHYLADLQLKGIPVVKTWFMEPGSTNKLEVIAKEIETDELVLKPAISGAARHTYRIKKTKISGYESIFQQLTSQETMMVQPFIKSILNKGEISIMMFGARYSHAVLKKGKPGDFRVQDDFGGKVYEYQPTEEAIELAVNTVNTCPELPFYARIDLVWDNDNKLVVSELELVEPELFFRNKPVAAELLAREITSRI